MINTLPPSLIESACRVSYSHIIEDISAGDTVYRGHDITHEDPYINWHSADPKLASEYAVGNNTPFVSISKSTSTRPINLGHDRLHLTPTEILHHALDQKYDDELNSTHREAFDKFNKHFGKGGRVVFSYWNSPENKAATHSFLKSFGFDGIRLREGKNEVDTIGILK